MSDMSLSETVDGTVPLCPIHRIPFQGRIVPADQPWRVQYSDGTMTEIYCPLCEAAPKPGDK